MKKPLIFLAYILIFWGALPVVLFAAGFRMDELAPWTLPGGPVLAGIGIAAAAFGAALVLMSTAALWFDGKGLPVSHLPPLQLVSRWPYSWFRHPIYVGYSLLLIGIGAFLNSPWTLAFSAPLLVAGWVTYIWVVEEPKLVQRFGDSYKARQESVGLFAPKSSRGLSARLSQSLAKALNHVANDPIFLQRGPVIIVKYGVMSAIGAALMVSSTLALVSQAGVESSAARYLVITGTIAAGVVSWVFWWIPRWRSMIVLPWFGLTKNGFVSYGGFLGVICVALIFCLEHGLSPLFLIDVVAIGVMFPYIFGRVGCIAHGCCWGEPYDGNFSVSYWHPDAKVNRFGANPGIARSPTQFYSALHGVICLVAIIALGSLSPPSGTVAALGFAFFGAGRLMIDAKREDPKAVFGALNYSQLGAVFLLMIGVALLWVVDATGDARFELWSAAGIAAIVPMLPVVVATLLIALFIFGFHWRRIGSWAG